jgi:hypothetical protein
MNIVVKTAEIPYMLFRFLTATRIVSMAKILVVARDKDNMLPVYRAPAEKFAID